MLDYNNYKIFNEIYTSYSSLFDFNQLQRCESPISIKVKITNKSKETIIQKQGFIIKYLKYNYRLKNLMQEK